MMPMDFGPLIHIKKAGIGDRTPRSPRVLSVH
jgi:hypothetical protein